MQPGDHLDGYTILRLIGKGGYGEVWLCRSDAVGDLRALKHISTTSPELLEKEFGAIGSYRKAAARLRSPHLMPVEHVGRTAAGLYYVMPLADGSGGNDPTDPGWQPQTLATLTEERAKQSTWFACHEIADLMHPVMEALQTLADAGLVHRDVKPDNILFFGGQPCLADISLLDEDSVTLTRRGTPGYLTPSWYIGGHPDMYGAAATIYTLLTGNQPDRMGRGAYTAPPQGLASLTPQEAAARKRLHAVLRRATDERVAERYPSFLALAAALAADPQKQGRRNRWVWLGLLVVAVMVASAVAFAVLRSKRQQPVTTTNQETTAHRQTPKIAEDLVRDGSLAYSSLTAFNSAPEFQDKASLAENQFYWEALSRMEPYVCDAETLDFPAAVRILDELIKVIPLLDKQPAVVLSRLLWLQCAGETSRVQREVEEPALLVPGEDDPFWRSMMLCRLHRPDKAEELINKLFAKPPHNNAGLATLYQYRAAARAQQGKLPEAAADAAKACEIVASKPVAMADLRMALAEIEKEFPAYAEYLRAHPPKPGGK
ncbi:MAG: phosphotransferase [Verrucomicrobiota bacterium]